MKSDHDTVDTAVATPNVALDSLTVLTFSKDSLPASIHPFGKVMLGARWRDVKGLHYLVISEHKQGMMSDPTWVNAIYARKYDASADSFALKWEVKEYAECCSDAVEPQASTLRITDLDGDREAETLFGYRITPDGADAERAKLFLHVHDQKYAVRGQFAGMEDDLGRVEKHQLDSAFQRIDPAFSDYAEGEWSRFQADFYKSWK